MAVAIKHEFLQQRAADALRQAADQLSFDKPGVDRLADVVGDRVVEDGHLAGLGIHLDGRDVRPIGVGHPRRLEHMRGGEHRAIRTARNPGDRGHQIREGEAPRR